MTITHVTFSAPGQPDVRVPLAEAWAFFEAHNYRYHPERVHYAEGGWSFASPRCRWDATMERFRLTMIAVGTYSSSGPRNPDPSVHGPYTPRLVNGGWMYAINWPTIPVSDAAR